MGLPRGFAAVRLGLCLRERVRACEQASKQLISHYKGEAERLLTMSQKSKAVAKSNRAEMMEREVRSLTDTIHGIVRGDVG